MSQLQEFFTRSLEGQATNNGEIGQLIRTIRLDKSQLEKFFQSVKEAALQRDIAHGNYQDKSVGPGADMTKGLAWLSESNAWDQVVCTCRQELTNAGLDYTATLTDIERRQMLHEQAVSVYQHI